MIRPVLGVWSGLFGTPVLRPGRERRRFDVYPRTTEFTLPSVSRTQTLRNHLLVVLSTKAREPVPYTFSTLFPRDLVPLCSYCHNGHEHTSDRSLGHDQVGVMYWTKGSESPHQSPDLSLLSLGVRHFDKSPTESKNQCGWLSSVRRTETVLGWGTNDRLTYSDLTKPKYLLCTHLPSSVSSPGSGSTETLTINT